MSLKYIAEQDKVELRRLSRKVVGSLSDPQLSDEVFLDLQFEMINLNILYSKANLDFDDIEQEVYSYLSKKGFDLNTLYQLPDEENEVVEINTQISLDMVESE